MGGQLEDAACGPEESMFKMTVSPQAAPDASETVVIEFVKGVPVKITNKTDGTVKTDPLEIFLYCNMIAGKHAIGRIDIVENRFVGIKSRGVYETPGGTLLREAHVDLEGNCMIKGRSSPNALYNADLASMDIEGGGDAFDYNPADAQGFIRINAVRLKTYAALRAKD